MTRPEELPPLSEAQIEIMNVLWRANGGTVAAVWKSISARREIARNTVQTVMTRLEEKGWLTRRAEGAAFRYFATRPREATQRRLVRRLVETAFAGSARGLVLALLADEGVSKDEAGRIAGLIDKAEKARRGEALGAPNNPEAAGDPSGGSAPTPGAAARGRNAGAATSAVGANPAHATRTSG